MSRILTVYPGSNDSGLTVSAYDEFIRVSSGGTATSASVSGGGEMTVFSGGKASGAYIREKGVLHVSKGGSASNPSISGGIVYVSSGGKIKLSTVGNNGSVFVYSGGVSDDAHFFLTKGSMFVSGGKACINRLTSGGWLGIYSGGLASDNVLSGGSMIVSSGGKAVKTDLQKGAVARIYYGGVMKDTKVNVYFSEGGELHVSNGGVASNTTTYWLMNVSMGGVASKTTVAAGSMCVLNGGSAVRTTITYGNMILSLGGMATKTTVASGSMIVSSNATATDNTVESFGRLYVSSGGTAAKTTVKGGYMEVLSGAYANSVTLKKGDALFHISSGASVSKVVANGGRMYVSKGATVTNITNNGAEIYVAKGAVVSKCNGNPLVFADADNDNCKKGKRPDNPTAIPSLEKIAKSTSKLPLDKDGSVSANGMINFVGPEDEYDYAKISLSKSAASVSFRVEATSAAKFTIWKWNGTKMVSLQSTALKKGQDGMYTVNTRNCVLEKDGDDHEYYISVQALNVKKGGFAYYNVYLNTDACIYYSRADNGKNNILVDSEKNLVGVCETISLGMTSKQVQMDKETLNYEGKWNNFVGHDDDTDYAKIALTQDMKSTFTIEAKDAAKFTICKLVEKSGGSYSLKTLQSKTLAKQKNGTYKATLTCQLKKDDDLYICMKSTNAKKGGNAYYNVTYTPVAQNGAALSGPEEDLNAWIGFENVAADFVPADDALAESCFVTLSCAADCDGLRMPDEAGLAASPIPVAAPEDIFAELSASGAAGLLA
jgi:autotransporter passenger strand-loop-strand repeat protein